MEGGYSNVSAAGSKLTKWGARPTVAQCVIIVLQYVLFPDPAGPMTNCAYFPILFVWFLLVFWGLDCVDEEINIEKWWLSVLCF
jgi:hypothetical protein